MPYLPEQNPSLSDAYALTVYRFSVLKYMLSWFLQEHFHEGEGGSMGCILVINTDLLKLLGLPCVYNIIFRLICIM